MPTLKKKLNFSSINAHTDLEAPRLDFRDVQFDDQEHVVFMKNDLTKVSFLNTDISKIKFGDVIWGNNFKILEETELEKLLNLKTTGIMVGVR